MFLISKNFNFLFFELKKSKMKKKLMLKTSLLLLSQAYLSISKKFFDYLFFELN